MNNEIFKRILSDFDNDKLDYPMQLKDLPENHSGLSQYIGDKELVLVNNKLYIKDNGEIIPVEIET